MLIADGNLETVYSPVKFKGFPAVIMKSPTDAIATLLLC
jgi:hypothetical protein